MSNSSVITGNVSYTTGDTNDTLMSNYACNTSNIYILEF